MLKITEIRPNIEFSRSFEDLAKIRSWPVNRTLFTAVVFSEETNHPRNASFQLEVHVKWGERGRCRGTGLVGSCERQNFDPFAFPKPPFCKRFFGCLFLILLLFFIEMFPFECRKTKSKLILWYITTDADNPTTNQNSKQIHVADSKRGKTCVMVLLLIGWKSGASFSANRLAWKWKTNHFWHPLNGKSL